MVVDHGVEKKTSPRSGGKVKPPGKGPLAVRTDIFSGPTRDDIQVISIPTWHVLLEQERGEFCSVRLLNQKV